MDKHTQDRILSTFEDVDLSIIAAVLYFDGWMSHEECGGYLIFRGIDGSIQRCEYGHCVMVDDNSNPFLPVDITHDNYLACVKAMEEARERMEF